ncbi:hypothetical protein FACS189456_2820 [Bacteroidia bacterium]|nr:hypothetical protein FACS189456_2820 [Bacteroidia bacterium]
MAQKALIIGIIAYLLPLGLLAQVVSGSVKDDRGMPVARATIYVEELQLGASTDENGEFRLQMSAGDYTCAFQCVGYTSVTQKFHLPRAGLALQVVMPVKTYEIPAVMVSSNKEDPAYGIMRQVIGMAPYYSNQVESYTAEVYIKGSATVGKISRLVKMLARKELKQYEIVLNKPILLESLNEITFKAPNDFHHKVISTNNTLPTDFKGLNTIDFVQVNVYQSNFVSRDAFRNYRFSYEGFTEDNGLTINKIKLTPRTKNPMLVSGYIYVIENTWNIYSVDFQGDAVVGKYKMIGNCHAVKPNVYLPVAFSIEGDMSVLGNKFSMSYQLAIKYKDVILNTRLSNPLQKNTPQAKPANVAAQNTPKNAPPAAKQTKRDSVKQQERLETITQLLEKQELNNREMNKLAKLMQESSEALSEKSLDMTKAYKVEVDTNARKMDTAQWNALRPIPLKEEEILSYQYADSINKTLHSNGKDNDTSARGRFLSRAGRLLTGRTLHFNNNKSSLSCILLDFDQLAFNAVDGFVYGTKFQFRNTNDSMQYLRLLAEAKWAFARKALMWELTAQYRYLPERRAGILFHTGIDDRDYNPHRRPHNIVQSLAPLLTHNNYTRLYERFWADLRHEIDLANGLTLITQLNYIAPWRLQNHTNFSFFYPHRNYVDNVPYNTLLGNNFSLNKTTSAELVLAYTPEFFYRMRGKQKVMVKSKYPTFVLHYKKAIPHIAGSTSDFDFLKFGINQKMNMGFMSTFSYNAEIATFLNHRNVDFTDFYHFNMQGFAMLNANAGNTYERYYKFSSNSWGASAEAAYTSLFIALKYLPLIDQTYCRENVRWHFHYSPHGGYYNELNYSISEIFLFLELGVFVGFEDTKFSTLGVNIKVNL